jgi:signal peptidase II
VFKRFVKFLSENRWSYVFLLSIAGAIIALDQWSKWMVRTKLPEPGDWWAPWPWLAPYARIVHWTNTGAAFGMFAKFGDVFMIMAIIVSIAILYYFPQVPHSEWPLRIAMGLQLGGAVGNLIDRVNQKFVTDFISVGNFAVFNVADSSISIGVAVLLIGIWYKESLQKKLTQPQAEGAARSNDSTGELPPEEHRVE